VKGDSWLVLVDGGAEQIKKEQASGDPRYSCLPDEKINYSSLKFSKRMHSDRVQPKTMSKLMLDRLKDEGIVI
jgi:hypothetical protein